MIILFLVTLVGINNFGNGNADITNNNITNNNGNGIVSGANTILTNHVVSGN